VVLWHSDYEGPRSSAAWIYDYKVILNHRDELEEMYDVMKDKVEKFNLLQRSDDHCTGTGFSSGRGLSVKEIIHNREDTCIHRVIAAEMTKVLIDYIASGDLAHRSLLREHPHWTYNGTLRSCHRFSDPVFRGVYGGSQTVIDDDAIRREQLINNFSCPTMCGCEQKVSSQVPSLPFHRVPSRYRYLNPGKFLNGSKILDLI